MGTPEFGAMILRSLIKNGYPPFVVITSKDKPVGRKQIITPSPVKVEAQNKGIEVLQPMKLNEVKERLEKEDIDLIITAAYSKLIPRSIIDLPKYGCINIHPSLLPEYRGPSPIQYAILNGNKKTGVTIMLVDEQIDHGQILLQKEIEIIPEETSQGLHDKLADMGAELLLDLISELLSGNINPISQDHSKATYTKIIEREDGQINWEKPPEEIERMIRAFTPWPGAYTFFEKNGKLTRLKILKASLKDKKLIIKEVQPEGKKPMSFEDFLLGNPEFANNKNICTHIQI